MQSLQGPREAGKEVAAPGTVKPLLQLKDFFSESGPKKTYCLKGHGILRKIFRVGIFIMAAWIASAVRTSLGHDFQMVIAEKGCEHEWFGSTNHCLQ